MHRKLVTLPAVTTKIFLRLCAHVSIHTVKVQTVQLINIEVSTDKYYVFRMNHCKQKFVVTFLGKNKNISGDNTVL